MRNWYGIELRYGVAVDDSGLLIGTVYRYGCRSERDDWVAQAGEIPRTSRGHRLPLDASTPEVRRAEREETIVIGDETEAAGAGLIENRRAMTRREMKDAVRARLRGTKSMAKHGKASQALKAARAELARIQAESRGQGRLVEAEVRAATAACDGACREMGLDGVPAAGGPLHPER